VFSAQSTGTAGNAMQGEILLSFVSAGVVRTDSSHQTAADFG